MFMSLCAPTRDPSFEAYLISRLTAGKGTAMVPFGETFITCGRGAEGAV